MVASILSKIPMLLNRGLQASAIVNTLKKADPRIKGFIEGAITAGYGANEIVDYLNEQTMPSGRRAKKQQAQQRVARGVARPTEQILAEGFEAEERESGLPPGVAPLLGGLAGSAMTQQPREALQADEQITDQEENEQPEFAKQPSYFERAMEGISFFDLDDTVKPSVGKLKKRLDELEQQGIKYEDTSVQRIVKGLRKLAGSADEAIVPGQRPSAKMQEKAAAQDADQQFVEMMQGLAKRFNL